MKQQKIAEKLQEDCHKTVEAVLKESKKVSYQDATNVWLFNKLAEMELRLQELENCKNSLTFIQ